ncbi:MAG: hypothetical protein ABIN99_12445 [Nitrosospira sp.]
MEFGKPSPEFTYVGFRDDGRYEIKCSLGHEKIVVLQQQKFEVLFEIGAHAIIDGYYREAVSSFTSSLERFYEFALRVFFENSLGSELLFESCWKTVVSQSERQLGAFIFLWALKFNEAPGLLSDSQTKFRNDVIHKGKIPTREEAIKYGNSVLDVLRPKILMIRKQFCEEVSKVTFHHVRSCFSDSDNGKQIETMCVSTILNLIFEEPSHLDSSMEEQLIRLAEQRKMLSLASA